MLNKIWFWLLFIGIAYGFAKASYQSFHPPAANAAKPDAVRSTSSDKTPAQSAKDPGDAPKKEMQAAESVVTAAGKRLNDAVFDAAKTTVDICLKLIGVMALWLGLLNVAKDAGLIEAFARLMRPFMRWLFPEVPDGHPAQGAMLMSFAANMLGLDNAATPMGLKAMEELQTLNPVKDTATNSMALFMAINCGSITLIPFTIIGLRAVSGSKNPSGIIVGTWIASLASVVAGVAVARWLARSPWYAAVTKDSPTIASSDSPATSTESKT